MFLNLSLELQYGENKHYVTLATFTTQSTFEKAIRSYAKKSDQDALLEQGKELFDRLNESIENIKQSDIVVVNELYKSQIETLSSVRFDERNKEVTHTLNKLDANLTGIKYSELRMFPGNFSDFKRLINRYNFITERSEEKVKEMYEKYKNKVYIVVSYTNDLDGTLNNATQARLVPISVKSRTFDVVVKEIRELREDLKNSFDKEHGTLDPEKRDFFNAQQQSLLSTPQILRVLVNWARTTTTVSENGLSKEVPLINYLTQQDSSGNSVLDILNRFKTSDNTTTDLLKKVIDIVKSEVSKTKNDTTAVTNVLKRIHSYVG